MNIETIVVDQKSADAVRIMRKRGELMQEAIAPEAGCMVSVLMRDVEKLEHICHRLLNQTKW
ncbi:hypothetical protein [Paenibacillus donghaensis]|uniref:Uncharacterized protein n=1 Tax=Paenibacillus donghaensis TaxID=414771 RepID=A0A2Z2KW49_9BACL|nr:hypothetical protein [Paenibacillus donghaensis]ASA24268.1 hypothetical protein B9T62_28010 [Paenibacillus donghaensis]